MESKPTGIYIHIPFCVSKCSYCDFLSFGQTEVVTRQAYVEALVKELAVVSHEVKQSISTVYIGGGTPSILTVDQFSRIGEALHKYYDLSLCREFTIEMNPGTVTMDKLMCYKKYGVDRVSMGLQSDDNKMLERLGRIHTVESFIETYNLIKEAGIDNISVDLMFGLPDQSLNDLHHMIKTLIDLNPNHISAYSLIIEEDTPFEDLYDQGLLQLPTEEIEREMFWKCHDWLIEAGYEHYEISNYAKKAREAIHNSSYWNMTEYYGFGIGASSYVNHKRYKNISDLHLYNELSHKTDQVRLLEKENSPKEDLEEALFLGLRRLKGVNTKDLADYFGNKALDAYGHIFKELEEEGLLKIDGHQIALTKRGLDISNQVFARLLLD